MEGQMTANKNFKRRVRARAAKTGESYTAALRHFRTTPQEELTQRAKNIHIAVAQNRICDDPSNVEQLRACGSEIRDLVQQARRKGARLVHFPEGALCSPHKLVMSSDGPDKVGPADWSRANWDILQDELLAVAAVAKTLEIWVVLGSIHQLTPPNRPHNSLYVISDKGKVVTRYDERMLSSTKISFMYSPGSSPVTFEVDGFRFGCSLGMEVHFPELFLEYEQLDVDCVLFSTTGRHQQLLGELCNYCTECCECALGNCLA